MSKVLRQRDERWGQRNIYVQYGRTHSFAWTKMEHFARMWQNPKWKVRWRVLQLRQAIREQCTKAFGFNRVKFSILPWWRRLWGKKSFLLQASSNSCGRHLECFQRKGIQWNLLLKWLLRNIKRDVWQGLGNFSDVDTITMFADYRVPQALFHFGAMEYSEKLYKLLSTNHMFINGDQEEMEIRGCSIHVS